MCVITSLKWVESIRFGRRGLLEEVLFQMDQCFEILDRPHNLERQGGADLLEMLEVFGGQVIKSMRKGIICIN